MTTEYLVGNIILLYLVARQHMENKNLELDQMFLPPERLFTCAVDCCLWQSTNFCDSYDKATADWTKTQRYTKFTQVSSFRLQKKRDNEAAWGLKIFISTMHMV